MHDVLQILIDELKGGISTDDLQNYFNKKPSGVLVLRKGSTFDKEYIDQSNPASLNIQGKIELTSKLVAENEVYEIYKYQLKNPE